MPEASAVRQPNTSPRPTAVSPKAVSWANRPLCARTVCCMNSRKNPTGFPSAYFPTSSGITCIQRSDALRTGRKPHSSVTDNFVNSALANHTPTAIRRTASQRSGERIGGAPAMVSIGSHLSEGGPGTACQRVTNGRGADASGPRLGYVTSSGGENTVPRKTTWRLLRRDGRLKGHLPLEGDPLPPCRTRCGATSLLLRVLAGCAAIACRAAGEQHRPDAGEQHRPDAAGAAPEVMGLDTTQAGTDTPPRKSAAGDRSSLTVVIDNARLLVVDPRGARTGLDPATGRKVKEIPG